MAGGSGCSACRAIGTGRTSCVPSAARSCATIRAFTTCEPGAPTPRLWWQCWTGSSRPVRAASGAKFSIARMSGGPRCSLLTKWWTIHRRTPPAVWLRCRCPTARPARRRWSRARQISRPRAGSRPDRPPSSGSTRRRFSWSWATTGNASRSSRKAVRFHETRMTILRQDGSMIRIPLKEGLLTDIEDTISVRMLGGRCPACERFSFPAQDNCPYCFHAGCESVSLSPHGVVEVCTTVTNRPPGYEGSLPFGFGAVELPEGIQVIARVNNPERVRPGAAVRLVLDRLCSDAEGREVMTHAFEAVESTASSAAALTNRKPGGEPVPRSGSRRRGGRPVYVSGVGIHAFGRFENKTVTDMGIAAVRAALSDAGGPPVFQAAYCGTVYSGVAAGHKVLTALGLTGM